MARKTLRERFDEKYEVVTETGCWIWIGGLETRRYGSIFVFDGKNTMRRAHRVSWELHHGPIPDGLCVLHKCDVTVCVNPSHLFLGTQIQNIEDMHAKRRARAPHGEHHGFAKLTNEQIEAIRAADGTQQQIAEQFGLGQSHVSRIKRRESWRHVP